MTSLLSYVVIISMCCMSCVRQFFTGASTVVRHCVFQT